MQPQGELWPDREMRSAPATTPALTSTMAGSRKLGIALHSERSVSKQLLLYVSSTKLMLSLSTLLHSGTTNISFCTPA